MKDLQPNSKELQNVYDKIKNYWGNSAEIGINTTDQIISIGIIKRFLIVPTDINKKKAFFKMWLDKHFYLIYKLCIGMDDETKTHHYMRIYY